MFYAASSASSVVTPLRDLMYLTDQVNFTIEINFPDYFFNRIDNTSIIKTSSTGTNYSRYDIQLFFCLILIMLHLAPVNRNTSGE